MKKLLFLLCFFPLTASAVTTVNRYVDSTCGTNGDGTVASPCASGGAGSTGPYNQLKNAISDIKSDNSNNLVTADVQVNVFCSGSTLDRNGFSIATLTQDATRYLHIQPGTGQHAHGTPNNSLYRVAAESGVYTTIDIQSDYTRIQGIQIWAGGAIDDNGFKAIRIAAGNTNVRIYENIIYQDETLCSSFCGSSTGIDLDTDATGPKYVYNNIIYNFDFKTTNKAIDSTNFSSGNAYIYSNTIAASAIGIEDGYSDLVVKNNIISASTTCVSGSINAASDYNSQTCAAATGANSRSSQTFTFVGAPNYHLSASDAGAKGFGVDLSADGNLPVSVDIDGDTRASAFDIGADETVATATGFAVLQIVGGI